jgi:hypothetical protein
MPASSLKWLCAAAALAVAAGANGDRATLLEQVLALGPGGAAAREFDDAAMFLVRWLPEHDLALSAAFVAGEVRGALQARAELPWGRDAPWPVFLNDVLPFFALTEPRQAWRPALAPFMRRVTSGCGAGREALRCAAEAVLARAWEVVQPPIIYVAAAPNQLNSYAPLETMARHNSSCTGLAVFLVAALRSVAVPARVAGVPHWNKGAAVCPRGDADPECGNHNWAEVWVGGRWHFVDPRGAEARLDKGWFFPADTALQQPGQLNHSVFAASFAPPRVVAYSAPEAYAAPGQRPADWFPLAFDWGNHSVSAFDVAQWYHDQQPAAAQAAASAAVAAAAAAASAAA